MKKNSEKTYYRYTTIISVPIAKRENKNESYEPIGECG